ncbi:MAG: hypothetical protein M1824_004551 [Vezdaea acicularis]|nr:MAG: hypothetical protein M1824_004551 [Vezdaea acicularis]
MSFEQLMPVLLSMPESDEPPSLPFKFMGGFGLPTKTIGFILSCQGVFSMIVQPILFPFVVKRFGTLNTFRLTVVCYPVLYFIVPYLVLLPPHLRLLGIYLCLMLKVIAAVLAYPSNAILLTNSAPSALVLGTINGVAASTASLARAFGPTISGLVQSAGLKLGYSGVAWWAGAAVCVLGAVETLWMVETKGRLDADVAAPGIVDDDELDLEHSVLDPAAFEAAVSAAAAGGVAIVSNLEDIDDVLPGAKDGGISGTKTLFDCPFD